MLHGWCLVPSLACYDQTVDGVIPQAVLNVEDVAYLDTGRFQYWVHLYCMRSKVTLSNLEFVGIVPVGFMDLRVWSGYTPRQWSEVQFATSVQTLASVKGNNCPAIIGEFRDSELSNDAGA